MITGHIAISLLLRHYSDSDARSLLIGGIFPDLVDKTVQSLGLISSGRTLAHTLLSWALTSLLVWRYFGRKAGRGWLAGYLAHLLADADGFIPWFYPFRAYDFPRRRRRFNLLRGLWQRPSWIEMALLLWVVIVMGARPLAAKK